MSAMYPVEKVDEYLDDGTMPENVAALAAEVVGHRIVSAERAEWKEPWFPGSNRFSLFSGLLITLDNGTRVRLADNSDCCAFTEVENFLLHADRIEHVITGVGTTDRFTTWHIYADMGDVLEMSVGWSCGNPFYYAYGFTITVEPDVIVVQETARRAIEAGEVDRG